MVAVVDMLGVTSLHTACIAFLQHSVMLRNCVSVYSVCQLFGYVDVAKKCVICASQDFTFLMDMDEFLDMPISMLQSCLTNKMLSATSENALLNVRSVFFFTFNLFRLCYYSSPVSNFSPVKY